MTKTPHEDHGCISLYGEWDDCRDYQFGVIWHESGISCDVLMMSGCDYGGGVTEIFKDIPKIDIEQIVNKDYSMDAQWTCKEEVREFCKEFKK